MTVTELMSYLYELYRDGKGDYNVIASTQDGACYDVDYVEEGPDYVELS